MNDLGAAPADTWEVFLRVRRGLSHQHIGSVRGHDADTALAHARDLFARRGEPVSLWIVPSHAIRVVGPDEKAALFSNARDKEFRYPQQYVPLHEGGTCEGDADE